VIVLDASVVVELLTSGVLAESLRHDLAQRDDDHARGVWSGRETSIYGVQFLCYTSKG
jgi:hypothetical protein